MKTEPAHCIKVIHRDIADYRAPKRRYIVSQDIVGLLKGWARERGFQIPDAIFFDRLRQQSRIMLTDIFPRETIEFIPEAFLLTEINKLASEMGSLISLDRVYCVSGIPLDITRMIDDQIHSIGLGSRTYIPIDDQYHDLGKFFRNRTINIIDDVIYGGESMIEIIKRFNTIGVQVADVIAGVLVGESGNLIIKSCSEQNPELRIVAVTHFKNVIDEICERDFYAGVPFSGKLVGHTDRNGYAVPNQPEEGAPYFMPFGDALDWASIPQDNEREWSRFCLFQSIVLWQEIENVSGQVVLCKDLARMPRGIAPNNKRFVDQLQALIHEM